MAVFIVCMHVLLILLCTLCRWRLHWTLREAWHTYTVGGSPLCTGKVQAFAYMCTVLHRAGKTVAGTCMHSSLNTLLVRKVARVNHVHVPGEVGMLLETTFVQVQAGLGIHKEQPFNTSAVHAMPAAACTQSRIHSVTQCMQGPQACQPNDRWQLECQHRAAIPGLWGCQGGGESWQ